VPLPIVYNLRSVKERWTSSLVAIIGIAGTVSVFIAMLALARGFQATLVSSGQPQNAIVQQAGADSEMTSAIELDAVRMVEDQPQVARRGADALVSPEVVVIFMLRSSSRDSCRIGSHGGIFSAISRRSMPPPISTVYCASRPMSRWTTWLAWASRTLRCIAGCGSRRSARVRWNGWTQARESDGSRAPTGMGRRQRCTNSTGIRDPRSGIRA